MLKTKSLNRTAKECDQARLVRDILKLSLLLLQNEILVSFYFSVIFTTAATAPNRIPATGQITQLIYHFMLQRL